MQILLLPIEWSADSDLLSGTARRFSLRDGDQIVSLFYAGQNLRQRFLIHRLGVLQLCLPVMHALTPRYPVKIT